MTPLGPGKIESWRVERSYNSLYNLEGLRRPVITYTVKYPFGIGYIHQMNVKSVEMFNKTVLNYRGVSINFVDRCRLWPETYLNDSIINFYIKYLQHDTIFPFLSKDDFYIFPTYFYTRLSSLDQNGAVAYKNTPQHRRKMYLELKGWTKNVNIFQKKLLCIPINYDLHWTLIIVCNPGKIGKSSSTEDDVIIAVDDNKKMHDGAIPSNQNGTARIVSNDDFKSEQILQNYSSLEHGTHDQDNLDHVHMTSADAPSSRYSGTHVLDLISPRILHCDSAKSLRLHRSQTLFKTVRKYLNACWEAMHLPSREDMDNDTMKITASDTDSIITTNNINLNIFNGKSMEGISPKVPQQHNLKDCGVYLIKIMESILNNPNCIVSPINNINGTIVQQNPTTVSTKQSLSDNSSEATTEKSNNRKNGEILDKCLFTENKINEERARIMALIYDLANADNRGTV